MQCALLHLNCKEISNININYQLYKVRWSGKTDGTPFMQKALISIFRYVDVRVGYAFMAVVILFYMLFRHSAFMAQYNYFRKCYGNNPLKACFNVYLNHFQFGQVILDRFATYAGKQYRFEFDGKEVFDEWCGQQDGFIIAFSHTGNYEISGYNLKPGNKHLSVLAYSGETQTVMQNRQKMFERNNITIIPMGEDMTYVFLLKEALEKGDIVSMPADRGLDNSRHITCRFFGREADIPMGPFYIAVTMEKKMLAVFVMKKKWDTYRVIMCPVYGNDKLSKNGNIRYMAQAYADMLERIVRQYPTQWYHYVNFWKE